MYSETDTSVDSSSDSEMVKTGPVSQVPSYIRSAFIQKVYTILSMQLLVTVLIGGAIVMKCGKEWALNNVALFYVCMFGSMGLILGVSCCCSSAMKTFPQNYLILFTFTVMEAVVVGFVSLMYTGEAVILAVGTTALIFFGLTAYACLTKSDFTGMGPYLMAALLAMMSFALIMSIWGMFAPVPQTMRLVYAFFGVLLFSFFIVYDTQLIVGGNHKTQQFEVDDYCLAALSLYLDIINLFLYLLELFGARD